MVWLIFLNRNVKFLGLDALVEKVPAECSKSDEETHEELMAEEEEEEEEEVEEIL